MDSTYQGFVIDPVKCIGLSLDEKRELVREISLKTNNARDILQSWGRQDLLQLICAEIGKDRKYTGLTKPNMIDYLLKLVSEKNGTKNDGKPINNHNGSEQKRRKIEQMQIPMNIRHGCSMREEKERVETVICNNVACQASLSPGDKFCKRCSCCICYHFDDNKDPSLWLACNSDPPYPSESCGMSCHLKCALKHEQAGILKHASKAKLDGSYYCVYCGKINWLIGSWRKNLQVAKEARRVDVLCIRLSLCCKMLLGTEGFKCLQSNVITAARKLKKEVGPLDKMSATMARSIVNRLACGAEVQKLCAVALEAVDSLLSGVLAAHFTISNTNAPVRSSGGPGFQILFEELTASSVIVALQYGDNMSGETIIGYKLWHRSCDASDYPDEPTCVVLAPDTSVKIYGLSPWTMYFFRASPFSSTREVGTLEAQCTTQRPDNNSENSISSAHSLNADPYIEKISIVSPGGREHEKNSISEGKIGKDVGFHHTDSYEKIELMGMVGANSVPPGTPCKPDRPIEGCEDSGIEETADNRFAYCVRVIKGLECDGHMDKEFRAKFLTWLSLKATTQEKRVVHAFIDVLIDDPPCLVSQLIDAFGDAACATSKKSDMRRGFCTKLWH